MEKFFVITNVNKDTELRVTQRIKDYLELKGAKCEIFSDNLCLEDAEKRLSIPKETECILVLGGDGTMLQAARENLKTDIPMIGINMGTKGYLTEIEVGSLTEALDCLLQDEYHIESRMMLNGVIHKAGQEMPAMCALNEISITRKGSLAVIHYNVYVNGKLLKVYSGDGIMVSTPTGSTAYNLSAGGPIVAPTASLLVITPICSHALNTSSIVLSAEDEIVLEVSEGRDGSVQEAVVSFDGEEEVTVHTGERIRLQRAETTAKLIKLSKISFLEIMREKMRGN